VDVLKQSGIELRPVVFYENRTIDYKELPRIPFDRVLFTSTSTVNAYFTLYPEELDRNRRWLAVGPSTLRALEKRGLPAKGI
jgi:uroporphyrinogen-III synthase